MASILRALPSGAVQNDVNVRRITPAEHQHCTITGRAFPNPLHHSAKDQSGGAGEGESGKANPKTARRILLNTGGDP